MKRTSWKIFSGLFFYTSCLVLITLLLFQLKAIQTYLAQKALEGLSEKSGYSISIDKVKISWLDRASINDLLIIDTHEDTLAYANELEVNYRLWNLMKGDFLNIEEVVSSDVILNLVKYDSASKINLTEFINTLKGDGQKDKRAKSIKFDQVSIANFNFRLNDKSKIIQNNKVDFSHFDFKIPAFNVDRFEVKSDTISGDIIQMIGADQRSGFNIRDLATNFRLTAQSLVLDNFKFQTPTSALSDSLAFFFNGLDDLAYFVDSVSFVLHLNNSKVSPEDVRLITGIDKLKSTMFIDGVFWGKVGDFNIEDARIAFGENTFFEGGVSCFGLPNIDRTFLLADITKSRLLPSDIEPYVGTISENLRRMGKIDFNGSFAGFLKDFVARGDFYTSQGSVHTDINLKIPNDPSNMSYTGKMELKNVNIGAFLKNDIIQRINLKASIKGVGIRPENADFNLNASVFESGLKGYVYDSVFVDGHFAKNFFEGSFSVNDPNCVSKGTAQVDLRSDIEKVDLNVIIDQIYADRLNLSERELFAKGHINLTLNDLSLDNFTSLLSMDSSLVIFEGKEVVLDSVRFSAELEDSIRVFKYAMPGLKIDASGNFKVTDIIKDIPMMIAGYANKLEFKSDTFKYESSQATYKVDVYAEIADISSYLDSLRLPISFYGNTQMEASFRQSRNLNLSFFASTDSMLIGKNTLTNPSVEINGAMDKSSSSILTNFIISSDEQRIPGVPPTEDLLIEGVWLDENIDFTSIIKQPTTESNLRLETNLKISKDSLLVQMRPSDIEILNDTWKFNPSNLVIIKSDQISISNFEIYDSSESLKIDGIYSGKNPTEINLQVEDLEMDKVNLFADIELEGFLNGNFKLFRNLEDEPFKYDGGFLLKNLKYGNLLVGDVTGSSNWSPNDESIYTNIEVERKDFKSIQVRGFYYPLRKTDQLDFEMDFDQADLEMVGPFVKQNFSNIGGTANGFLKIVGTTKSPKITGNCVVSDGKITIDYLNTNYTFDGRIIFDPTTISFSNFNLRDRKGANARLSGTVTHNSYSNLISNIRVVSNNFEFLNTTSLENKLYYGSAYGSGTIDITGPFNDLVIKANIRTEADTRFFIPISESTNIGLEEYIQFVDLSDTTSRAVEEKRGIKGLTLDFDIEVTPDAYCELIFDIKTGDIIRGRGRGNIKLSLDTDGEFNMFGPLEITEGAYNFTVPNLINKEFDVVSGSRITWYGDPYNATLDLEATYQQRASFEELKNAESQNPANLADKIPFLVVLILDGSMLNPDIKFDIRFQNPSDATAQNESELEIITGNASNNTNNEELRRQVISLLFLKRFTPRQSFALGGGGSTIGSSVSEFLSSQVSYLVSQIDENLEVEVNLADLNQEAFNTFQLRFAYTFLGGRLKVTRGGSFGNQEDQNENVLNDIVGDWSVEYSLTKDGRLRAKVFRNSNQRLITSNGQQSQETGVSLRFVHSFNDLKDLLSLKRDEAIRRREEELDEVLQSPDSNPNLN